jgi:hypothetical protein
MAVPSTASAAVVGSALLSRNSTTMNATMGRMSNAKTKERVNHPMISNRQPQAQTQQPKGADRRVSDLRSNSQGCPSDCNLSIASVEREMPYALLVPVFSLWWRY